VNRVAFLIDGFNVYHSVKQAIKDGEKGSLKWLDYRALCESYVRSSVFGKAATLGRVVYFTAYATHLTATRPDVVQRHRLYVSALESRGIEVIPGRFKWKPRWCPKCKQDVPGHEEKETDVSIAVTMLEMGVTNASETIVVVTGDTDLIPAIRIVRRLCPDKQLWAVFPYARFNEELRQVAHGSIKIKRKTYGAFQLPDPVTLPDGSVIRKPASW